MPFAWSPEAEERPKRTAAAATTLAAKAADITRVCANAELGDLIVAVVNPDGLYGGVWAIPQNHLHERASRLPEGGWSLTFKPGTSAAQVLARCQELTDLALKRLKAIQRCQNRSSLPLS